MRVLSIVRRHDDDLLTLTGYAWGQDATQALRQQVSRLKSMAARNAKDKVMAAQVRMHLNPFNKTTHVSCHYCFFVHADKAAPV